MARWRRSRFRLAHGLSSLSRAGQLAAVSGPEKGARGQKRGQGEQDTAIDLGGRQAVHPTTRAAPRDRCSVPPSTPAPGALLAAAKLRQGYCRAAAALQTACVTMADRKSVFFFATTATITVCAALHILPLPLLSRRLLPVHYGAYRRAA